MGRLPRGSPPINVFALPADYETSSEDVNEGTSVTPHNG
jgi:hypothetical protein